MNILIVNGSPKGEYSITLQTCLYLEKQHPEHTFSVLHVGQTVKQLEKNFLPAKTALEAADLLLFSYPVYTFLAPSQLHRFLELVKAANVNLSGKFATQITTSKHFYDVTAHRYIEENANDLGLKFIRGLSADMDDLLSKKGQKEARDFFDFVLYSIEHDLAKAPIAAQNTFAPVPVEVPTAGADKSGDVVIVADLCEGDTALADMIARFRAVLPKKSRVVNIADFPFKGGCLGCFHCATDGTCIYQDGFDKTLREEIQTAEAIVLAFTVRDHSMGARFKMYDDRQFCNGHRTVTMGMPFGYLVNGAYRAEQNLRTVVEARAEVGGNYLCGVATNEVDPNGEIDRMAERLCYAIEHKYTQPSNFYGVGGMKIFRDLIWIMQGMMKADHRFYKKHGQYDFPQKQRMTMIKMYFVGALLANKKIKAKLGNKMNEGMLAPYKHILTDSDEER